MPALFGYKFDGAGGPYYLRNASLFVLPMLTLYFLWKREVKLTIGLWLALFFVLAIAFTPLTHFMLRPLTIQEEIKDADLVVVLGGGVDQGRYLALVSSHRMVRGIQLYFEGRARKILFSGGIAGRATVSEAVVMNQEAGRLRVPPEDILLEKLSKNTHDQAIEIKKMAERLQMNSILLVTSFSHLKRALMAFEHVGSKSIRPLPIPTRGIPMILCAVCASSQS